MPENMKTESSITLKSNIIKGNVEKTEDVETMQTISIWDKILKLPSFDPHLKYWINIKKSILLDAKLFQSLRKGVFFY